MSEIHKILFAAGGTGGHVFPAIAVADALRGLRPDLEIAFVGASHGNESGWVQKAGYRFILLDLDFIKGASLARKIKNILALPGVARKAGKILDEERPDLVIGAGGYVSGPIVAVAAWRKIRTAIMEQNAIPGLTNRILSGHVDKIYISFEHTLKLPQKKTLYFGNPVRSKAIPKDDAGRRDGWQTACTQSTATSDPIHLLVFGGSQGAMRLNKDVPVAIAKLTDDEKNRLVVWHQAGRNKLEETKNSYKEQNITANITEFIDDMGEAYRWADLIVCRAGATSIAEIRAAAKASILVPFPFAAHNHQDKNADAMVEDGASLKVPDSEVADRLTGILSDCLAHPEKIASLANAAFEGAKPEAALDIAKDCLGID